MKQSLKDLFLPASDFFRSHNTSDIKFFVDSYNPGYIKVYNSFR